LRLGVVAAAALLWQAANVGVPRAAVDVRHLKYVRALTLQGGNGGMACAVLDPATFAHAASRSGDDLRVFGVGADGVAEETPFALTESAAQPVDVAAARVENLGMRGGDVVFDLVMPLRVYSEVDLQLGAKDFVATAKVSGVDARGGAGTALGSFALFDLTGQGLSRSTALPLQEESFARLHVALKVRSAAGGAFVGLGRGIVEGAMVPASREAQTLYTVVASGGVRQEGSSSEARIDVPAHVPVERVSFVLDDGFKRDFLRGVTVSSGSGAAAESVDGEIERVTRAGVGGEPEIRQAKLSVDAVMGSNLRGAATYVVTVRNGDDAPLPIRAVQMEMRQRRVCFAAKVGSAYTLRYGDVALRAPVYDFKNSGDFERLYADETKPVVAVLGAETVNAEFVAREDSRPYTERHPEVLWIALLAVVAALGATALHGVKQQGKKGSRGD
jgi:hypothetical protein